MTDAQLAKRIEIARRYKFETCGNGEIKGSLYGEPDEESTHIYKRKWEGYSPRDASRISQWALRKEITGGIVGVMYDSTHTRKTNRFRAIHPDNTRTYHDCAVEAAEARNKSFAKAFPGLEVAQCDLRAVKKKWGCKCGNHRRGK